MITLSRVVSIIIFYDPSKNYFKRSSLGAIV